MRHEPDTTEQEQRHECAECCDRVPESQLVSRDDDFVCLKCDNRLGSKGDDTIDCDTCGKTIGDDEIYTDSHDNTVCRECSERDEAITRTED